MPSPSRRRPQFRPRPEKVEFVMDKVEMGYVFLCVLRLHCQHHSISPLNSFILINRCYVILKIESVLTHLKRACTNLAAVIQYLKPRERAVNTNFSIFYKNHHI